MAEYNCKKCGTTLVVKENMFYYRGTYLSGLVCEPCNALYNNPEDSFLDHIQKIHQENANGPRTPTGMPTS